MSNPHFDKAIKISKSAEGSGLEVHQAMYDIARAQMNATLALAFEARTANLIAAYTYGIVGPSNESVDESTILIRLGLGDTK